MTNTKTTDIDATLEQINSTVEAGVDIVRVSCPDKASTLALKEILNFHLFQLLLIYISII